MAIELKDEIKQAKPFESLHEEAQLNVVRTANLINDTMEQMFKTHGITITQYNVLRILRGAGSEGLCRNEVSARLFNRMPDATRLLDRMEEAELVTRERSDEDRRLVRTQLTKKGRKLVNDLDDVVRKKHEAMIGHLSQDQLKTLISLLTLVRNPT